MSDEKGCKGFVGKERVFILTGYVSHADIYKIESLGIDGKFVNSKGVNGVSWYKPTGRWKSYVGYKNKTISLGYFDSKEDAAFIAALARKKLYGTYASKALNCEHELLSQFNNDEDKLAEYLKEKSKRTRKRVKNR